MAPAFSTWKGQKTGKSSRTFRFKTAAAAQRASKLGDRRTMISVAKSVARATASNREKKYLNNGIGSYTAWDTAGQVSDISVVPLGTSVNQRVGKQVLLTGVQLRGTVVAGTATRTHCAMMLVYDREPNQAASLPAITDILNSASSNSQTNRDNAPRFKIVRRWDWPIIGTIGSTVSAPNEVMYLIDEFVPLKRGKYPIKYTAANTDGANTGKVKGNLMLVTIGDQANGATTPSASIATRVDFEDS